MLVLRRFNGATAFQPWKVKTTTSHQTRSTKLQWGHGISAVESVVSGSSDFHAMPASMGPRHFSRGKNYSTLRYCPAVVASMGPRHFSRGKYRSNSRVCN